MSSSILTKTLLGASTLSAAAYLSASNSGMFVDLVASSAQPQVQLDDTGASALDWEMETISDGAIIQIGTLTGVEPFRIHNGATTDSLVVTDDGNVGISVAQSLVVPSDDLHVGGGQVKLDPTGSIGDWQLNPGGTGLWFLNEDATPTTPVKFNNNAPTNSLVVEGSTGDIGLGTSSPTASLDIQTSDGSALFQVQNSSSVAVRQMMNLRNTGGIRFSMENTSSGDRWDFNNDGAGNFGISFGGTGMSEMRLFQNGNMLIQGTLSELSDRDSKKGFAEVDCDDVLDRIAKLPVTTWSYKSDDDSVRHMGPVAQDFRETFGLGENDVTIAVSDKIGVSLAGIQALNSKMESKDEEIAELENELSEVTKRMERLEAAFLQLSNGK